MKKPTLKLLLPALIVIALISCYIILTFSSDVLPGDNWDTIGDATIKVLPAMLIISLGLYTILGSKFKGILRVLNIPLCFMIGVAMAYLTEVFYDNSWLIDEYISVSLLLSDLQIGIVVLFLFVGVGLAIRND